MMKMEQKSRRKLLCPGGLITLSILPFLFFSSLRLHHEPLHALEVTYWDPTDTSRYPIDMSRNPMRYMKDRFDKILLTGNLDDRVKLDYAQVAIRGLMQEKDTTLGIEFTFTKNAKYSSLIKLYDLCETEHVNCYLNYQDKFWVFNLKPKLIPKRYFFTCGNFDHIVTYTYPPKPFYMISFVKDQPIKASLALILFVMLIFASMRRIRS